MVMVVHTSNIPSVAIPGFLNFWWISMDTIPIIFTPGTRTVGLVNFRTSAVLLVIPTMTWTEFEAISIIELEGIIRALKSMVTKRSGWYRL